MNITRTGKSRIMGLAGLAILAVFCLSCGGQGGDDESVVVASVGNRTISLRQITDYLTSLHVNYPDAEKELEARRRHLDRLIEEKLFVIGAYSEALDADIGIIELVDREKDKFLLDELFRNEVIAKASVSEADIKDAYEHWFDRVRPSHIVTETRETADSVLKALREGSDFGDLAEAVSIDRSTGIRNGDLGRAFRWGELIEPLGTLVFSLEEGEVGGPVKTDVGWHVVKIRSRTQTERVPLEEIHTLIENTLTRKAQEMRRREQLEELRARTDFELNPNAVERLREVMKVVANTSSLPTGIQPDIPLDDFSETERAMIVATWGTGNRVRLDQLCETINSRPAAGRPDINDDDHLREFLFQMNLFDILREEAMRLKLDQTPIYKERLLEYQENLMAEKMRSTLLSRTLTITEDELKNYYEAHPDSFMEPVSYHIREVLVNDEATAQRILDEAKGGTPLEELAKKHTKRPGFQSNGGDLGWVTPVRYGQFYEYAKDLKPGEIGEIVPGVDQYSVFQLLEIKPAKMRSYEEVSTSIFDSFKASRTDSIIRAYTDSLKVLHPVNIDEEALRRDLHVTESSADSKRTG